MVEMQGLKRRDQICRGNSNYGNQIEIEIGIEINIWVVNSIPIPIYVP